MIYFIQAGEDGPIKIGFTALPIKNRMSTLQTNHYNRLNLLGLLSGTLEVERHLHARFATTRMAGEWFQPSLELYEFIWCLPPFNPLADLLSKRVLGAGGVCVPSASAKKAEKERLRLDKMRLRTVYAFTKPPPPKPRPEPIKLLGFTESLAALSKYKEDPWLTLRIQNNLFCSQMLSLTDVSSLTPPMKTS